MKKTAVSRKIVRFTVATAIALSATTATAHAADLSAGEPEPESISLLLPAVQKVRESSARSSTSVVLDVSSGGGSTEMKYELKDLLISS